MKPLAAPPSPDLCHTVLGIIRHGRTAWNDAKRMQGHTDTQLNARGREQAAQWAADLDGRGWQRIICSDLTRAVSTAEIITQRLGLEIIVDPRLREQDWGEWTGSTIRELRRRDPDEVARQEALGWEFTPPGGESRRRVYLRALAAMADACMRFAGERVLIVAHNGVRMVLAYGLKHLDLLPSTPNPLHGYHMLLTACRGDAFTLLGTNAPLSTNVRERSR